MVGCLENLILKKTPKSDLDLDLRFVKKSDKI